MRISESLDGSNVAPVAHLAGLQSPLVAMQAAFVSLLIILRPS